MLVIGFMPAGHLADYGGAIRNVGVHLLACVPQRHLPDTPINDVVCSFSCFGGGNVIESFPELKEGDWKCEIIVVLTHVRSPVAGRRNERAVLLFICSLLSNLRLCFPGVPQVFSLVFSVVSLLAIQPRELRQSYRRYRA
jgi:hypothetical protein